MIERELYPDLDLVVHVVTGELDRDEFRDAIAALYELEQVPRLSLWDLSGASLQNYRFAQVQALQYGLATFVRGREGGRTAAVAPGDVTYGVARQYLAASDEADLPFEQRVFRTRAEALEWLGIDPAALEKRTD